MRAADVMLVVMTLLFGLVVMNVTVAVVEQAFFNNFVPPGMGESPAEAAAREGAPSGLAGRVESTVAALCRAGGRGGADDEAKRART